MKRLALLGTVVALAAGIASTALAPGRQLTRGRARLPSTSNPGRHGLGAAAAWLDATGRPFNLWRELPANGGEPGDEPEAGVATEERRAPTSGTAWLLISPLAPVPPLAVEAFLEHAARGGLSVWAIGPGSQPALEAALKARRAPGEAARIWAGRQGHPLLGGLVFRGGGVGVTAEGGAMPGTGTAMPGTGTAVGTAVPADPAAPERPPEVVTMPVGQGEVVVLGSPALFENGSLAESDHLSLWVRLAARGPITFDERWLRVADVATPSPRIPLLMAAQAALVAIVLLVALGQRHGAVRPPPAPATLRSNTDYLASLAALTRRAGAEEALAAASWARLRRRLEHRTGLPAHLTTSAAADRLEARAPAAAEALRRGEAALNRPGKGHLLAVTRAAAEVEADLAATRRGLPGTIDAIDRRVLPGTIDAIDTFDSPPTGR